MAYFSADPAEGEFNTHESLAEAISGAKSLLEFARDVASDDGWVDDPPQICYGVVLGGCVEKDGSRKPAPEGRNFSEMVDFRLTEPAFTYPKPSQSGIVSDEACITKAQKIVRDIWETWYPGNEWTPSSGMHDLLCQIGNSLLGLPEFTNAVDSRLHAQNAINAAIKSQGESHD